MTYVDLIALTRDYVIRINTPYGGGLYYYKKGDEAKTFTGFSLKGAGYNDAYQEGFKTLGNLITQHLQSLPLDQMSGKEVEESLFNTFLHIQ